MNLRKNLINERKNKNLTQVQISEIFGITVQHYQRIEAGTSDGSVKLWQKLSKFFNKSIDYLLENDADKTEDLFPLPSEGTSPTKNKNT